MPTLPENPKKDRGLLRGKLPHRLLILLEGGDQRTYDEWADYFNTNLYTINNAFKTLRVKGFLYYPVGGVQGFGAKHIAGKMVKITDRKTHVREVVNRHKNNILEPQLKSFVKITSESLKKFPELYEFLQEHFSAHQAILLSIHQELNENRKPSTLQNPAR